MKPLNTVVVVIIIINKHSLIKLGLFIIIIFIISSIEQVINLHIIVKQYSLMVIRHKKLVTIVGFIINLELFTITEPFQFTTRKVTKLQFTIIFFY